MSAQIAPSEVKCRDNLVTLVLRTNLTEVPWSDIVSLGDKVERELMQRRKPSFVVDLSTVSYIGSAAVALLVRLWKTATGRDGKMVVICRDPVVLEVLHIAALDKVWTIVPNSAIAERELSSPVFPTEQELALGSPESSRSSGSGGRQFLPWIAVACVLVVIGVIVAVVLKDRFTL